MDNLNGLKIKIITLLETSKRLAETFLTRFAEQDGAYLQPLIKEIQTAINTLENSEELTISLFQQLVSHLIGIENNLRIQQEIGVRYSVVATQIKNLDKLIKDTLAEETITTKTVQATGLSDKQQYVYVHLFNTQGGKLVSWLPMFAPKALSDHSVNRPIYENAAHVEELIRSKTDIDHHAYLTVIVDKDFILMSAEQSVLKDQLDHPLLRLKQGAIKLENIISFHHAKKAYRLQDGKLVAKEY